MLLTCSVYYFNGFSPSFCFCSHCIMCARLFMCVFHLNKRGKNTVASMQARTKCCGNCSFLFTLWIQRSLAPMCIRDHFLIYRVCWLLISLPPSTSCVVLLLRSPFHHFNNVSDANAFEEPFFSSMTRRNCSTTPCVARKCTIMLITINSSINHPTFFFATSSRCHHTVCARAQKHRMLMRQQKKRKSNNILIFN